MRGRWRGEGDPAVATGPEVDPHLRPGVPREQDAREPAALRAASGPQRRGARAASQALARPGVAVFGTGQPLHGVSGAVRRAAYRLPEHGAGRWALLLAGDRIDVLERRLARGVWLVPAALALAAGYAAVSRALARR